MTDTTATGDDARRTLAPLDDCARLDDYAPEMQDPGDGDMFGAIADAAATARPECTVCRGAGEVEWSTTPKIDPRDPRCATRTDPCGECEGTGIAPAGEHVEPWVEQGEYAAGPEPTYLRCECGDLNGEHEAFCYRCGAGPDEVAESEQVFQYEKAEGLLPGQTVDPAFDGFLLTVQREGETSRPDLEASAIALGLCWRDGMGSLCLTPAGRKRLREAAGRL